MTSSLMQKLNQAASGSVLKFVFGTLSSNSPGKDYPAQTGCPFPLSFIGLWCCPDIYIFCKIGGVKPTLGCDSANEMYEEVHSFPGSPHPQPLCVCHHCTCPYMSKLSQYIYNLKQISDGQEFSDHLF